MWRDYAKTFEKLGMADICYQGSVSCSLGCSGKGRARCVGVGEVIDSLVGLPQQHSAQLLLGKTEK